MAKRFPPLERKAGRTAMLKAQVAAANFTVVFMASYGFILFAVPYQKLVIIG